MYDGMKWMSECMLMLLLCCCLLVRKRPFLFEPVKNLTVVD